MTRTTQNCPEQICRKRSRVAHRDRAARQLSVRHRLFLGFLSARGGEASLVELADDIASWMDAGKSVTASTENVRRTYLDVHSTVVDELGPRGIVEYCEREGLVTMST